ADLEVLFLENVQEPDLDARLQVGQLVDREDAAVRARNDAVVDDALVRVVEPQRRSLDRVDVADQIRDRDVRRRELLLVALVPVQPADRRLVAVRLEQRARVVRERHERVAVQRAALDRRDPFVEEAGQRAQQAGLGLGSEPEQDEVVPREERVDDLRLDGQLVADDAREQRLPGPQPRDEVGAQLVLDGAGAMAGGPKLAEGAGARHAVNSWVRTGIPGEFATWATVR